MKKVRIGSGGGYAGDRIEPAIEIVTKGNVDYIVFECLAERTIALAQQQKLMDPQKGYNELLEYRMERIIPVCAQKKVKIITNMGAANPTAAMRVAKTIASDLKISNLKIAAVLGDDVLSSIDQYMDFPILETREKVRDIRSKIISANAYLGVEGIIEALREGADIVITGRVADPSLFLAPILFELEWEKDNYDLVGKGIVTGHLLECGAQITGGYFADPGYKDVPDLWRVGFPIAEIYEDGDVIITKLEDEGGVITPATCTEQLLYEIHDPSSYITPDGIVDFSDVVFEEIATNKILVKGATGKERPDLIKVSIGYKNCCIGEGEISYGGSGAYERAKLAKEIILKRLEYRNVPIEELRVDYIGVNSLYKDFISSRDHPEPSAVIEVRLRVAARTSNLEDAKIIGNEVEALYTNGPAGGGGARKYTQEIVSIASILIPRDKISIKVIYEEL
ncbi:MAG: acyclic terpene utilization AtuA family protein [Promethearchaeota archaeon]